MYKFWTPESNWMQDFLCQLLHSCSKWNHNLVNLASCCLKLFSISTFSLNQIVIGLIYTQHVQIVQCEFPLLGHWNIKLFFGKIIWLYQCKIWSSSCKILRLSGRSNQDWCKMDTCPWQDLLIYLVINRL